MTKRVTFKSFDDDGQHLATVERVLDVVPQVGDIVEEYGSVYLVWRVWHKLGSELGKLTHDVDIYVTTATPPLVPPGVKPAAKKEPCKDCGGTAKVFPHAVPARADELPNLSPEDRMRRSKMGPLLADVMVRPDPDAA